MAKSRLERFFEIGDSVFFWAVSSVCIVTAVLEESSLFLKRENIVNEVKYSGGQVEVLDMNGGFHYEPGFIVDKPCATRVYVSEKDVPYDVVKELGDMYTNFRTNQII